MDNAESMIKVIDTMVHAVDTQRAELGAVGITNKTRKDETDLISSFLALSTRLHRIKKSTKIK